MHYSQIKSMKTRIFLLALILGVFFTLIIAFYTPMKSYSLGISLLKNNAQLTHHMLLQSISKINETEWPDKRLLERFNQRILDKKLYQIQYAVLDPNGNLLFNKDLKAPEIGNLPNKPIQIENREEIVFISPVYTEETKLTGYLYSSFSKYELNKKVSQTRIQAVFFAIISVLILLIFAYILSKYMTKSIKKMIDVMKDIVQGEGDLTIRFRGMAKAQTCSKITKCNQKECRYYGQTVKCWYGVGTFSGEASSPRLLKGDCGSCIDCPVFYRGVGDEFTVLATWFNTFMDKLHQIISHVIQNVDDVASATSEIKSTAKELAHGSEEQARQAEQVVDCVQDITEAVSQNSKAANYTAKISEEATSKTQEGMQAMSENHIQMESIIKSTQTTGSLVNDLEGMISKIGDITDVINEIAD